MDSTECSDNANSHQSPNDLGLLKTKLKWTGWDLNILPLECESSIQTSFSLR